MSLMYTEEQKALIALVKEMAENEIKPYVKDADEKGECPKELYKWGFDMGLHMLEVPAEYGGAGLSYETTAMIFEELAKVDAGYAITFVTSFVALRNVILAGTKEQGQYFADKVAPGAFAGFALTEPNAGSDPAAMRATAVKDGDEYILNGTKTFITNGAVASVFVGFFKTNPAAGHKGISAFIIDADAPGVTVGAHENKMGLRLSNTTDLIFENVRVKASAMVGPEGSGFKLAMNALNLSRAFVATLAVGIMQRALLGIRFAIVDQDFIDREGKELGITELGGAYVAGVVEGGSASEAGIRKGDVILDIDGVKINDNATLSEQIGRRRPNDKVKLSVKRDGAVKQIEVTLRNKAGKTELMTKEDVDVVEVLGGKFADAGTKLCRELDIKGGVQVVGIKADGILARARVKQGFVITHINDRPVYSVADMQRMDEKVRSIDGIYPNGRAASYTLVE